MEIGAGFLEIRNDNGLATLTLRGDFDLANVPKLGDAVRDRLWPAAGVLVDLRGVTFMDGRLLWWLVGLQRDLQARGAQLIVLPGWEAHRLLQVLPHESFELAEA